MRGIILSGGTGTRLAPITKVISKQLLPIYNQPMVYYPLATLMSAGLREVLLITTARDLPMYQALLGDGAQLGITLQYKTQEKAGGIAEALQLGENFVGSEAFVLILGDNLFFGENMGKKIADALRRAQIGTSTVFGYPVDDPYRFGVAELDKDGKLLSIEEKPACPKSRYAVVGLYVYAHQALNMAKRLKPSPRGELEITDLNNLCLKDSVLEMQLLDDGTVWYDAGTPDSLLDAGLFVRAQKAKNSGMCPTPVEIAHRNGWIADNNRKERAF